MVIIRFLLGVISLGLALFCGWEAYLIHYWNSHPGHWLAGPLHVFGYTVSPATSTGALGVLALSFLCFATYAFFASRSNN